MSTSPLLEKAKIQLKERFGYSEFRPLQQKVISHVLQGRDALVLMPTGGGKSMCYQLPALVLDGLTVVVSPLIALMKDQVDALRLNGIEADFLNSSLSAAEQEQVLLRAKEGKTKLLYLSPERLLMDEGALLYKLGEYSPSLFAIDEAHCISQWGHDFRPEYGQLEILKQKFPQVPLLALTATADKQTRADIIRKLRIPQDSVFISSFDRANIHYHVTSKGDSFSKLTDMLDRFKDESGIIYCLSRKGTEETAEMLNRNGYSALPYHAGLPQDVRNENQTRFIKDEVRIICATIAFGMGIDKSNIRYVVHMDLPKNIEGYYQETGRAGRDGLKSEALLLFSMSDVFKLKRFCEIEDDPTQTRVLQNKLNQMVSFATTPVCRRKYLLNYFDEDHPGNCQSCDVCLNQVEKFDGTRVAQMLFSAVARLEERFGMGYVLDFLKGSKSQKIREAHKSLKTYGVGAEFSKGEWQRYANELLALGYLEMAGHEFPVLKLNQRSWNVLKGQEEVMLTKTEKRAETRRFDDTDVETELLTELKALRSRLASERGVAPFMVMHDSTLVDIAKKLPQEEGHLYSVSGLGAQKVRTFGQDILDVTLAYCQERGLEARVSSTRKPKAKKARKGSSTTSVTSLHMFKGGMTVQEVALDRGLTWQTVMNHLTEQVGQGNLDATMLLEKDRMERIHQAMEGKENPTRSELRSELGEGFHYWEIGVAMASASQAGGQSS